MSIDTSVKAREWLNTLPAKNRKLPVAFKRKWIEALRSGDYPRAKGELCKINEETGKIGYCCLGVAGRVLGNTIKQLNDACLGHEHNKKQKVPYVINGYNPVTRYLMILNDNDKRKAGFITISNWIEKYL